MTTMTHGGPFELRLAWARSLVEHGDHTAAATALRELVDDTSTADLLHDTTELRMLLARAYFGSAQLGRAEAVLRELVESHPDDGYLHLMLGRTLQRQGRHDDARHHLALAEVLGDHERPSAWGETVVA